MWPSWHAYEGLIRSLAGLGEAPAACSLPPVPVSITVCMPTALADSNARSMFAEFPLVLIPISTSPDLPIACT